MLSFSSRAENKKTFSDELVMVDGLIGGGKSLLADVICSYDEIDPWQLALPIELVCNLHLAGEMSLNAAKKTAVQFFDEIRRDMVFGRNLNGNFYDQTSMFRRGRRLDMLRFFRKVSALRDTLANDPYGHGLHGRVCLVTHHNIQNALLIQNVLAPRLRYFWITKQPASRPMILQVASWLSRWAQGQGSNFLVSRGDHNFPVTLLEEHISDYQRFDEIGRAVLLIGSWLERGFNTCSELENLGLNKTVITIPFEKFIVEPYPYLETIEEVLGCSRNRNVERELKRQKVPRMNVVDYGATPDQRRLGKKSRGNETVVNVLDWVEDQSGADAAAALEAFQRSYESRFLSE